MTCAALAAVAVPVPAAAPEDRAVQAAAEALLAPADARWRGAARDVGRRIREEARTMAEQAARDACAADGSAAAAPASPAKARTGGYLGLFLREAAGPDGTAEVRIERVQPGSGAEAAGFRAGDVVCRVGERAVPNGDAFLQMLWMARAGTVTVRRDGAEVALAATAASLDAHPSPGERAPDFTLATPDGKARIALRDLLAKGRPVVLVFGSFT